MALETNSQVWAYPVYPHADFTVELEYLTEIQRARDGTELRRAWRSRPRKSVRFTTLVGKDCYRETQRAIYAYARGPWTIPDVSRAIASTSTMTGVGTDIDVASIPSWAADGEAVLLRDAARVELRTIASTAGTTITFAEANSGGDWPIGTIITPALPGRMAEPLKMNWRRRNVADFGMAFDVTPGYELYSDPPATPASYQSHEIFTTAPSVVEPINAQLLHELEVLDFDIGVKTFTTPIDFVTQMQTFVYRPCSAAAAQLITDFFMRMRGRRGSFYMPTFTEDMRPTGVDASGQNQINVYGTDIASQLNTSTVFTNVAVQYADLSWQALNITGYGTSGSDTVLTFGSNLTQDVSAKNVRRISWLPRRRMASDRLSVSWRQGQPQTQLSVQTLEDDA